MRGIMINNLYVTKCKRCGKEITSLKRPIFSSGATMAKYAGICAGCMSDKEQFEMLLAMNTDISRKAGKEIK